MNGDIICGLMCLMFSDIRTVSKFKSMVLDFYVAFQTCHAYKLPDYYVTSVVDLMT